MRFAIQKKSKKNICTPVDMLKKICSNVDMTSKEKFSKGNQMQNEINEILAFSECCMEQMDGEQLDHEICPCCGEHCQVTYEDWSCGY